MFRIRIGFFLYPDPSKNLNANPDPDKISMRIRIQAKIAVQINIQIRGKCLGPFRNIDNKQPELHPVLSVPHIFSKLCHILLSTTRTTPSTDYVFPTYRFASCVVSFFQCLLLLWFLGKALAFGSGNQFASGSTLSCRYRSFESILFWTLLVKYTYASKKFLLKDIWGKDEVPVLH